MTPAFSGGKLRRMTRDINECAQNCAANLEKVADEGGSFDTKKHIGAFSADVIARVAFGVDIDSQNDPDHPFVKHMTKTLDFRLWKRPFFLFAIFLQSLIPLVRKLGIRFMDKDTSDYFEKLVAQAIEEREKGDSDRIDFLQIMLEAQEQHAEADENSQRKPLTRNDVISNCVIFFFAAYGTIGDTMSMILYALANNQDCQEKVLQEINEVLGDDKHLSYDKVKELTYMEMFVDEALRMYAPALLADRICGKEITINGIKFPKDVVVNIPIGAIHADPEIWPEPEKFIPERFTPEKKAEMNPMHWLPFGFGPRNCIGMRLALIEMKTALVHIVRDYKVQLLEPGQKLDRNKLTGSINGLRLKVERR
jgi:cytochrome P450 family 3 subfamily A